jgi:hypothetical protein
MLHDVGLVLFVGKVYSPQYGLWIVAMLAVIGAAPALAVAWSAADLFYFVASFVTLGLWKYGDEAQQWFADHGFLTATALREGMLLVVAGWCLYRMSMLTREPAQEDRGEKRATRE